VLSHKAPRPLVVKLGGSLAGSRDLTAWLAALDRFPDPLVVVPGGGAFAETVQAIQAKMRFDDAAAHHMALVAMEQFGIALTALWPRLSCVATLAAIRRALRMHNVACWAPAHMALAAALPKSWEVTSDTLSAWLASELRAEKLLLIKSVDVEAEPEVAVADLVDSKIVDPLFPHFAAASGAEIFIAGPAALQAAEQLLAQGHVPGRRIRLA
jgi:5-(aminomethyl)-3-furanmethanol phosphate kinase